MNEKISFLLPFMRVGENKSIFAPVLTYECTVLPVEVTLDIAFYFICLKNNKEYTLWFDIMKDNVSIIDDTWDRNKAFTAEDPLSRPDELAVGLNVNLPKVPFKDEGIYEIHAKIFSNTSLDVPIDSKTAFFKVKKLRKGS